MADIFISYSKVDHALALKLSAFLEAEGWSVWWDKSLAAADLYRDEIMKQLVAARAVITIWTPNSIKSDWVRAEAGAAKKDGKLIPVKTADVAYADIPLPFGEMHTENLESRELIRAAVVAQLAKPAVEPTAWGLLTKGFKYEVLTWVGIVGGAVTLFGNLDAALKLADWARLLVQHWKEWTHAFWVWAFGWLGIHLLPEWTPVLSFLLFWSLLTIGQMIKFKSMIKNQVTVDKYQYTLTRESWPKGWQKGLSWPEGLRLILLAIGIIWLSSLFPDSFAKYFAPMVVLAQWNVETILIIVASLIPLFIVALRAKRHRLHAVVATCLIVIFWIIITINQLMAMKPSGRTGLAVVFAVSMIGLLPPILLSVAPIKAVSRRLIFLALGLLLLIALNELSKLGLDVTAPKLQG